MQHVVSPPQHSSGQAPASQEFVWDVPTAFFSVGELAIIIEHGNFILTLFEDATLCPVARHIPLLAELQGEVNELRIQVFVPG